MLMYICTYLILIPFEDCETHQRHERYFNVVPLYTIIYLIIYIYILYSYSFRYRFSYIYI